MAQTRITVNLVKHLWDCGCILKLESIEFVDIQVWKKHEENTNLQGFGLEQIEQCIFIY